MARSVAELSVAVGFVASGAMVVVCGSAAVVLGVMALGLGGVLYIQPIVYEQSRLCSEHSLACDGNALVGS